MNIKNNMYTYSQYHWPGSNGRWQFYPSNARLPAHSIMSVDKWGDSSSQFVQIAEDEILHFPHETIRRPWGEEIVRVAPASTADIMYACDDSWDWFVHLTGMHPW